MSRTTFVFSAGTGTFLIKINVCKYYPSVNNIIKIQGFVHLATMGTFWQREGAYFNSPLSLIANSTMNNLSV